MGKCGLVFAVSIFIIIIGCNHRVNYIKEEGEVFGTFFHIIYESEDTLTYEIHNVLDEVNQSLSMYNKTSIISRFNQNDSSLILDKHFLKVLSKGFEISNNTKGAFDMTVAPLVNIWGFGFSKKETVTKYKVDSILKFVGFDKIRLVNEMFVKQDTRTMIDASAIAKGYGVDVVADMFDANGINNYLVEIGGEIRVKGINEKGNVWSIAIDKPVDDPFINEREFQEVLHFSDGALASSGNYRNFYYENGIKYAHTINPKTGYPVQNEVLATSVIAYDCMTADAYATSFMVLGLEEAMRIVNANKELEAYFICRGKNDEFDIYYSSGFEKFISK